MDAVETSRRIYETLIGVGGQPAPSMRSWTGQLWGPDDASGTIVLQHPGALRSMLLPPNDLSVGEAYVFDDIDFEGDMVAIAEFGARLGEARKSPLYKMRLLRLLRQLPEETRRVEAERPRFTGFLHSKKRDKAAVSHHYDTGNGFFGLFLDPHLVYSCAHFLDPEEPLDVAQRRKLDLVCRKLKLVPGMKLLDVGCGWGAFVVHAAQHYGVTVTGITLSTEQAAEARRRAVRAGVADQVTIEERDYRDVDGEFDAIASIGMVEHVGRKELDRYFKALRAVLAPGGQILNHGIVTRDRNIRRTAPTFVNTYVFPDGELGPVDSVVGAAEEAGFELRDIESLRASYALTLRHWVANLESNREAAVSAAGGETYRIWRLYMAASAVAFERAALSVYQLLLADPARPWTYGRSGLLAGDDR
jgi:cyclopropane-fatty-acyl-phospholipid synthase